MEYKNIVKKYRYLFIAMLIVYIATAGFVETATAVPSTSTYTGCLSNISRWNLPKGVLYNVSVGTAPAGICLSGDKKVSFVNATYINSLEARLAKLESLLAGVTRSGNNIYINKANLHIRSGSGKTDGTANGLGNLIIGYNEPRPSPSINNRTGSHNLIIGSGNNYRSYGGLVAGYSNEISGPYASVSGGDHNTASGTKSSISGGWANTASGQYSSVSGGAFNTASNYSSSVSGGAENTASGKYSSASGGYYNTASGSLSWVSGGDSNTASFDHASVSGGGSNTASGFKSSVSGGYGNIASNDSSSICGGGSNKASGMFSSVSGGNANTASGLLSSVSGGCYVSSNFDYGWAALDSRVCIN